MTTLSFTSPVDSSRTITFQFKTSCYSKMWRRGELPRSTSAKQDLPMVDFARTHDLDGTSKTRTTFILVADFDRLPEGYSWENLRDELKLFFQGAIVTTSASGKAKAFFMIDGRQVSLSTSLRADLLRALLPDFLFSCVDTSDSGVTTSFFSSEMVGQWDAQEGDLVCWSAVDLVAGLVAGESSSYCFGEWSTYQGDLPAEYTGKAEAIVRHILSTGSITDAAELPQKFIAKQTGVSLWTVNNVIKSLIAQGKLECVDSSYSVGVKAKSYRLTCPILIAAHKAHYSSSDASEVGGAYIPSKLEQTHPLEDGSTFINTPYWVRPMARHGMSETAIVDQLVSYSTGKATRKEFEMRVRSLLSAGKVTVVSFRKSAKEARAAA